MKRLIVILHYEHREGSRVRFSAGRLITSEGLTIPWFQITRRLFVEAARALYRDVRLRERFFLDNR